MIATMEEVAEKTAQFFLLPSQVKQVEPAQTGNIHRTFRLTMADDRIAFLQQVNTHIFDAEIITRNAARIGSFLCAQASQVLTPELIPTRTGSFVHANGNGHWRASWFIPETYTVSAEPTTDEVYQIGGSLGRLHRALSTMPVTDLYPVLPHLHNSRQHYDRLMTYVTQANGQAKGEAIQSLLSAATSREPLTARTWQSRRQVMHRDPKRDNCLLRQEQGETQAIGWLDLDTVGYDVLAFDFGDCARSTCKHTGDAGISFELNRFRALATGYLEMMGRELSPVDSYELASATLAITYELFVRRLGDVFAPEKYFAHEDRNQSRKQAADYLELLQSIEANWGEILTGLEQAHTHPSPVA